MSKLNDKLTCCRCYSEEIDYTMLEVTALKSDEKPESGPLTNKETGLPTIHEVGEIKEGDRIIICLRCATFEERKEENFCAWPDIDD